MAQLPAPPPRLRGGDFIGITARDKPHGDRLLPEPREGDEGLSRDTRFARPDLRGRHSTNPDLAQVLENALRYAAHWNVLRVSGLSDGTPREVADLGATYRLCVSLGRLKGAGAYVVDRAAAEAFVAHLLPMWLPFDHAVDREWNFGLRAAHVLPFPCCQTARDFQSSIRKGRTGKRPSSRRWVSTYPYQARNEVARWLFRGTQLSPDEVRFTRCETSLSLHERDRDAGTHESLSAPTRKPWPLGAVKGLDARVCRHAVRRTT
jgi:hypothetical protein